MGKQQSGVVYTAQKYFNGTNFAATWENQNIDKNLISEIIIKFFEVKYMIRSTKICTDLGSKKYLDMTVIFFPN